MTLNDPLFSVRTMHTTSGLAWSHGASQRRRSEWHLHSVGVLSSRGAPLRARPL